VETPGTGACSLNATDNTQGRLINGVAASQVCGTAASSYTGRFLHAEQDPGFRTASDWVQAVVDTWPPPSADPPVAPANLVATAGNAQVSLTWSSTDGADSYQLHRGTTSGGPYTTIASSLPTPSHLDTAVVNGTTYYYVVSAVNQHGEGPDSSEVSATPQAPQPPAAPTGLKATAGKKKATLSWNAVSGATSYRVKRSKSNGGPYTVVASSVTATTFTNTGLTSRVTYYYVVSAINANGEGANSAQVSVRPN
jgi:cellulose 1,4-beta-cellobiosidase